MFYLIFPPRTRSHGFGERDGHAAISITDQLDNIIDIREYDVPYHTRVCIDLNVFVGLWYSVNGNGDVRSRPDLVARPVGTFLQRQCSNMVTVGA